MSAATCMADGCKRTTIKPGTPGAMLAGNTPLEGLCRIHTMRAMVLHDAGHVTVPEGRAFTDAAPLKAWLEASRMSGTLTYRGYTIYDVNLRDLSDMTGVPYATLTEVASQRRQYVHALTAAKLMPYVKYVATEAVNNVFEVGQRYGRVELANATLGTVIVDARGRAWQHRGKAEAPIWCPAHVPRRGRADPLPGAPYYPATVVYVPPTIYTRTAY